jgi:hypothetical protein
MSAASALLLLVIVIVIVGFRRSSRAERSFVRAWGDAPGFRSA